MNVETAASVLRRARQQIVQMGWSPFDEGERLCIYSAVGLVVFGRKAASLTNEELAVLDGTVEFLCDAVGNVARIMDWELTKGRSIGDVLGAFDRAITAAEWSLDEAGGGPEAA